MKGETNLNTLLKNINPVLNSGDYVFCSTKQIDNIDNNHIINFFKEKEGYTLVLLKSDADSYGLAYSCVMSWITLQVHSSLESVGLTAAFSKVLAENQISCNVIAGYYHDHIFVPKVSSKNAFKLIEGLKASL